MTTSSNIVLKFVTKRYFRRKKIPKIKGRENCPRKIFAKPSVLNSKPEKASVILRLLTKNMKTIYIYMKKTKKLVSKTKKY